MRQFKLELIDPKTDVTFLYPNKKVTKEIGIGEALRANAPSLINPSRRIFDSAVPHSSAVSHRAPRKGYIGKGVFGARERDINAFPMLTSLVTFLFSDKKVTY